MAGRALLALACALAAVPAVLAACGEDRKGGADSGEASTGAKTTPTATTPARGGPVVATVGVRESEYRLDPSDPRVAKTGVVRFRVRNAGKITHALEVEGPAGEVESKDIAAGASATLMVDLSRPGTYEWYCPVDGHKDLGMKGRITVAGGGTGARKGGSRMHDDSGGRGGSGGYDSGRRGGGSGSGGGSGGGGGY